MAPHAVVAPKLMNWSDAEMRLIDDALGIAYDHYRMLSDAMRREGASRDIVERLNRLAEDASALQLKVEANR